MTKFRGCIDIHSGKVKQIVGGTLRQDDSADTSSERTTSLLTKENFVSTKPSSYYGQLYRDANIEGCHIIKLGSNSLNDVAAKLACEEWPYHFQVGGGINDTNALDWVEKYKASHVIVTSWLFNEADGKTILNEEKLKKLSSLVGKKRLIVDLSCRRVQNEGAVDWVVTINKWQTLTDSKLSKELLNDVGKYCDEFLIHAADVEGLCQGIDEDLVERLGKWCPEGFEGKLVYAGGAKLVDDLKTVNDLSNGKVDLTFGSALDIFGGNLVKFDDLVRWNQNSLKSY